MRVHFDEQADALYLRLGESEILGSEEIHPGLVLDFNHADEIEGVEILRVKERVRRHAQARS